jgi:hypothetical protein
MKTTIRIPSKNSAFLAGIFLLLSIPASAQITITSDQYFQAFSQAGSVVNYYDSGSTNLQPLVTQTGPSQTWTFQGLSFALDTTGDNNNGSIVPYPGGAALADSFSTATHVLISSSGGVTSYYFIEINSSGYYDLGLSQVSGGVSSVVLKYTPPLEAFAFPLTSQTSWTSTSSVNYGGFLETQEMDGLVDGWGSLELPGSPSTPVLRLRTKLTTSNLLYNSVNYTYQWISLSSYSATIDADSSQNATDASYSVPGSPNIVLNNQANSQFSIAIASNPVGSPTSVSFTLPDESQVRISLMDALGRESQVLMNGMAHAGVDTLPLDPANLMNGTYFLRMESDGNSTMQKVIVNR